MTHSLALDQGEVFGFLCLSFLNREMGISPAVWYFASGPPLAMSPCHLLGTASTAIPVFGTPGCPSPPCPEASNLPCSHVFRPREGPAPSTYCSLHWWTCGGPGEASVWGEQAERLAQRPGCGTVHDILTGDLEECQLGLLFSINLIYCFTIVAIQYYRLSICFVSSG